MYDTYLQADNVIEDIKRERSQASTQAEQKKDAKQEAPSIKDLRETVEASEKLLLKKFVDGINKLSDETGYMIDVIPTKIYVRKKDLKS